MKVCNECRCCFDDSEIYCSEESHAALSQIRDGSPEIIPGYRSALFLGADIKGETFYAHNTAADEPCLISIRSADDEFSRQFLTEAHLAAAFCHPNVVDVYEAGRLETGEVFVVSEDAEGQTLRQLLDTENVPKLLTTVQVVRQTAEALYALHTKGLTHGAINPQNIILTSDAQDRLLVRIKDLDLGGVVARSVVSNKFHNDSALESLRYFAPEQCSGCAASARADIYSLGVVLYEMLAGAPPFNASKAVGLIEQHRNQPPPEVRINDIDLRMLLTHSLTEALRKQPDSRQSSANAFARQMRHMEQLATHSSVPPPVLTMPIAPPKHEATINAADRSVPIIDTPKATYEESTRFAPAFVEAEIVFVSENEIESGSLCPDDPAVELPEILHHSVEELVAENVIIPNGIVAQKGPRRSRLTALKKKMRARAHTPGIPESAVDTILHHPVVEEQSVAPKAPRRSRLSALKAKLRSMVPLGPEISSVVPRQRLGRFAQAEAQQAKIQTVAAPEIAATDAVLARTPNVIPWKQREDDLPSEADVLEALPKKPVTEIPFSGAESQPIEHVPAYSSPTRGDLKQPEVPVRFLPDDLSTRGAQKVVYLPSLGLAPIRETSDVEQSGPMFSSFYSEPSGHHNWTRVGGGIVVLAALAFVGRLVTRDSVPADIPSRPAATSTTVQISPPQVVQPVAGMPTISRTVKNAKSDRQGPEIAQTKPLPSKSVQPPSTESSRNTVAKDGPKPRTPNTTRGSRKPGPSPSPVATLVITYGNGKIVSKTESGRSTANKKPAAPKKSTDNMRPRVVKRPN